MDQIRESGALSRIRKRQARAAAVSESTKGSEVIGGVSVPAWWPLPLPESARLEDEVEWVYRVFSRVVMRKRGEPNRVDLSRAGNVFSPSEGALGLLEQAAEHPNWFFKDLVPRVKLRTGEDTEAEHDREVRSSVAEIEEMLEELGKRSAERESRVLRAAAGGVEGAGVETEAPG